MKYLKFIPIFFITTLCFSQNDKDFYDIIEQVSEKRIEINITKLVSFGTRHTLSDTLSSKTGIGAARRWIKNSFEKISKNCNNCLEVFNQKNFFQKNKRRLVKDVWINNVIAIQRGKKYPNRKFRQAPERRVGQQGSGIVALPLRIFRSTARTPRQSTRHSHFRRSVCLPIRGLVRQGLGGYWCHWPLIRSR